MNEEERNLAAISHLGAILPIFGLGLVFISFLSRKEKSPSLQFQLLQAFVFQFIELLFVVLMVVLYLIGIFGSLIFSTFLPQTGQPFLSAIFPLIVSIFFFAGIFVFIAFSGIAAFTLFSGKEFEYPFLSIFIKKHLKKEEKEA
ncbi:MAG: DUF4870 domain-containing protein [Thermoanaerobaculia bacterium]